MGAYTIADKTGPPAPLEHVYECFPFLPGAGTSWRAP